MASRKKTYSVDEAIENILESDDDYSEDISSEESSDDDEACYRSSILFVGDHLVEEIHPDHQVCYYFPSGVYFVKCQSVVHSKKAFYIHI